MELSSSNCTHTIVPDCVYNVWVYLLQIYLFSIYFTVLPQTKSPILSATAATLSFFAESIQAFHLMYFLSVRSYFGVFFFFIHLSIPFVNCYQMRFIHTLCCCPSSSSAVSCVLLFPHSYLELPLTSPICVIFFD